MGPLKYKPDWPQVQKRWAAFWDRSETDRPCIDVRVPAPESPYVMPEPQSPEERWFSPDWVCEHLHRSIRSVHHLGEAIPSDGTHMLMVGWTHGCGESVHLGMGTIWHDPAMRSLDDADEWSPGESDPWREKTDVLLRKTLETARDHFLVTYPTQLALNDLLSMLRGTENLLMDAADDADRCADTIARLLPLWFENLDHFRAIVDEYQEGCTWGWPGYWSPDFVAGFQSDVSCMFGPNIYERYVMPELDAMGRRYEKVWYHLDGRGARVHLPRLLETPCVKLIQYVPSCDEEPGGPSHIDLYRSVQAAGRNLDIVYAPPENMEFLIRHLNPEGLVIRTVVDTVEQAEELLQNAMKWCGTHVKDTV